jgi:integrase
MKIQIEALKGRLRLRWHDGDKRQTLAIGVNDSPLGRSLAQKKKQEIEHDWLIGQYDRTLLKYRPRTIGKTASEDSITRPFSAVWRASSQVSRRVSIVDRVQI